MSENITASFLDQARKLNDQRLTAVQDIAAAVQARVDAEHALNHAQSAERKGWTKTELDRLRPTKRRRTNHPTGHTTNHTAAQTPEDAETGEADHDAAPSTP